MANWTTALDSAPIVEPPNAVAYVTYSSDDGRKIRGVRIPYEAEVDLLDFLARECARLSTLDDRVAVMQGVVDNTALVPGEVIKLPDISAQTALLNAQMALVLKLNAALQAKSITEALVIDPSIVDAQAAVAAAEAAVSNPQSVIKGP